MANSSSSEHSTTALSPLDRRALEQTENLKVLSVQVESARHELEKKRKEMEDLPAVHERRGKVCTVCHKQGHNKTKAPSTLMRFRLKTHTFLSVFAFRPH